MEQVLLLTIISICVGVHSLITLNIKHGLQNNDIEASKVFKSKFTQVSLILIILSSSFRLLNMLLTDMIKLYLAGRV